MSHLLEVEGLNVRFPLSGGVPWRRRWLTAVADVGFVLGRGETLGVVGESGCGKSTLGRAVLGLTPIAAGSVRLAGERIECISGESLRRHRRHAQVVFQDPIGSLDPRMTVGQSVAEPLEIFEPGLGGAARRDRVVATLELVGLAAEHADRYPHEFSGGQCQRIGIARAVILRPDLVVCDEPVSALDVSVQGQVVNLLADLRQALGLAYLFISHNLAVVRHLSTRVLVMYLGRTAELAPSDLLYARPLHPYTRALLDAVPVADPALARRVVPLAAGDLPSPLAPPAGCAFHTRCPFAIDRCRRERPVLESAGPARQVACHRWREWGDGLSPAGST